MLAQHDLTMFQRATCVLKWKQKYLTLYTKVLTQ